MIVVDTNVLAYLYLPGPFNKAAERLLEEQRQWAAPLLWRSEFRNILAGYIRRGMMNVQQACAIQTEAEHFMNGFEYEVQSNAVLHLADQSDCSAYDCEFVALADRLNTRLVTMDKQLLKAFPKLTRPLSA